MRLNELDKFAKEQAVTGTALAEFVKDLGLQPPDFGGSDAPFLIVSCSDTAAGPGTLKAELLTSDSEDLSSPKVVLSSGEFAAADLETGAEVIALRLPGGDMKRYLGVRFVVAGGDFTAGEFNAFLTLDRQMVKAYKRGYA